MNKWNIDDSFAAVVIALVVGLVILAGWSIAGTVPVFNPELESWTKWVASIVAIIVSARVLWTAAGALVLRLLRP